VAKRGPNRSVSNMQILRVIRNDFRPVLGTVDIADEIEMSQQGAIKRLSELKKDGHLHSDKIGQARIWWLTDKGRRHLSEHGSEADNQ